jgi:GT2 family glycosyltransferase
VCDAFVSLHRSEGFGFCIAEVMALGKPAISTNFSGSIEFADESTACVVDCTMIPVEAGSYPFGAGQVWADPSIEQASWYMRKLVEDDAFRQQIATAGQRKILDCFSSAAIGRRYAARLSQLGILPVHDDAGSTARASGASEATLKKRSAATAQVFHLDQPSVSGGGKVVLSGAVEVTGWAISAHGIHRIGVRCGDRDLGRAHYGIMRPDVGEIHSEFPDSSRSGFSLMFDSRKLPDGPATLELVITEKGQAEHSKSIAVQIDNSHGPYEQWEKGNRRSAAELGKFAAKQNALGYKPLISLVVSVDGDENGHSTLATLRSIAEQIYPNWELIVRADRSMAVKLLEGVSQIDQMNQVRIVDPASSSLEGMLAGCRGDYIGIVGPGDRLDSLALFAITETLNADRNLELVYSDEVQSGAGAPRPLFKPAWSPILLKSTNYIGHLWVAKAAVLQRVAAKHDWDSATDDEHGLLLRVAAETSSVAHVPMVLCSRSEESGERTRSTRVMAAARKASNRERASVSRAPLVSIVIPTCLRDSTVTKRCFTSLLAKTSYPAIEVVVVTNNLEDAQEADDFLKIWPFMKLPYEGPFNWSAINNMGARQAQGEYLLFLNDDVEATYEDWLDRMMSCASQTGADIVGPILRYPNGSIQHGGMFLTDDGAPGRHLFRFCKGDEDEARNLLEFDREVSAVTGACMLVSRKAFDELGGFDETLPIICNDVDFCLRAAQRRYDCVLAAGVELIHHEGISRAGIHEVEDVKRFLSHWDWLLKEGDPYYNPNLSVESSSWLVDPEARGRLAGRKNSLRSNRQAQTGLPRTMGRSIPARHSG